MKERLAIVDGVRTPFCKFGGVFKDAGADDLGAYTIKELMARLDIDPGQIDELIMGNVGQPANAANVARVAALKANLPNSLPAYTVQRNCASGMEAVTSAANKIMADEADIIIASATESMSGAPLLFSKNMTDLFANLRRAKNIGQKFQTLCRFRPAYLAPVISLELGLTDPICGMIMGKTAEILASDFKITREQQDRFALKSHQKAVRARETGLFAEEIIPVPIPVRYEHMQDQDDGPRANQTMEALAKLKPYFEKVTGTVTAGNSSQVTDGAASALVMKESKAKELGFHPLGYLREYAFAALECQRMGLGPVYATHKLLNKTGMELRDFQLIELNEAFAAQVLACQAAFASKKYCQEHLGRSEAMGELNEDLINVNGGAIALGHPVGATGLRLIISLLKELRRRQLNLGLATLCVGGGQGAALALEVE